MSCSIYLNYEHYVLLILLQQRIILLYEEFDPLLQVVQEEGILTLLLRFQFVQLVRQQPRLLLLTIQLLDQYL